MAKATMRDVAERAGVDVSTVSRIINRAFENHKYSEETVARVEKAARDMGYRLSLAARSLRTGRTMLLGVVVADISNPFFSELAALLDERISGHGYRMVISNTHEDPARQEQHIEGMLAHGVDGLIVSPSGERGIVRAVKSGLPVVAIDRPMNLAGVASVRLDNYEAGRILGIKLAERGFRQVGVVVPHSNTDPTFNKRLDGVIAGLNARGGRVVWKVSVPAIADQREKVSTAIADRIRGRHGLPSALVGLNNVCTACIIGALDNLGIEWGRHPALSGIDDFSAASLVRPAVSVVAQPLTRIADAAADLLLKNITGNGAPTKSLVMIKPEWKERKSVPLSL